MELTTIEPGGFCWVDLGTSDAAGAKQFYTGLFGWETVDHPMGEGMVYTMLNKGGKSAAALYQDNRPDGPPPHWSIYVNCASVEASAEKAQQLGATVIMPPFDVVDAGRMAILQDPAQAYIHLWEKRQHQGFELYWEQGAFGWAELSANDVPRAQEFYTGLFGWTTKGDPAQYVEFQLNGRSIGGLTAIQSQWGPVPPNWMPYFGVENTDEAAAKAQQLGGGIIVPPTDIPEMVRFSVIRDPQGAVFGIAR